MKIKMGKKLQRKKECRGPEQKLKLGHALYEGSLQQNELVLSLTLKRGNWEQNVLLLSCLGGLAPSWICYCYDSPACALAGKIRVPVNQESSVCFPRQEASMTHLLDGDNVIS